MTADEQQLVIGAVTNEGTRGAAVEVMQAAELVTAAYATWYAEQTPQRQSAEWAPGGLLLVTAKRVQFAAASSAQIGAVWDKVGAVAGTVAALAGAPFRWLAWVVGGALVVVVVLVLLLRR